MKNIYFIIIALVFLLSSCSKEVINANRPIDYPSLIGMHIKAVELNEVLSQFEPLREKEADELYYKAVGREVRAFIKYNLDKGIIFRFEAYILTDIIFYNDFRGKPAFTGNLPYGLQINMSREDVEKLLGPPSEITDLLEMVICDYYEKGLQIEYNKNFKSTINFIACSKIRKVENPTGN